MLTVNEKTLCENCFAEITGEPCCECGFSKDRYVPPVGVLPVGSILMGKYIVGGVIGQGGFGITYRAYDIRNEKSVAVKEYYPNSLAARSDDHITVASISADDLTMFRSGIEKFYEEAKLVSKFNGNPNIVSVYEFFYENDTAYFVMEFLKGISLKSYIDRHGALSAGQALYILTEMANALLIAHSAGVLHRDISPDNIILCEGGGLKLIDFGAARQVMADNPKSMSVILKAGFAPLEQYQRRGKQGTWTDIYSLGATIYYSMTRECLDDPMTRMEDDELFSSNKFGIDGKMWELIRRATEIRIQDRYQDAFELKNAIKEIGITPEPIVIEPVKKPQSREVFRKTEEGRTAGVTAAADAAPTGANGASESAAKGADGKKPANKAVIGIIAAAAVVVIGAGIALAAVLGNSGDGIPVSGSTAVSSTTKPQNNNYNNPAVTTTTAAKTTKTTTTTTANTTTAKPETEPSAETTEETAAPETAPVTEAVSETTKETTAAAPAETDAPTVSKVKIGGESYDTDVDFLDLNGKGLKNKDIAELSKFRNLTILLMNDNNITDLSVLADMKQLEGVWADNNNLSDISFAKNLKNLKYISVCSNNITDISPLKGTTKLEQCWLSFNAISDISPIKNNSGMLQLGLSGCPIKGGDISILSGMTKLSVVQLWNCGIKDISALGKCRDLSEIDLSANSIDDVSPLKKCRAIKKLYVANNNTKKMKAFIKSFAGITIADGGEVSIWHEDESKRLSEQEAYDWMMSLNWGNNCSYYC